MSLPASSRSYRPSILVTNDDGIDSPGLFALLAALRPLGDVTVIAPDQNRTGVARSITMRSPLWVEEVELPDGTVAYATDGTPVDCVRMAALGFLERAPDLIVSGINVGANLGDDITYSGTVAAAFEGILLDIPALAVSVQDGTEGYDYGPAARVAALVVEQLLFHGFPQGHLLNVNCPDLPWEELRGLRVTRLGKRIYGDKVQLQETAGRRRRYFIYGDDLSYHEEAGTDFEAVAEGWVSLTPLHFDLNSREALGELAAWDLALPVGPPAAARRPGLRRRPEVVMFDLDGTVVDSVELIIESFRHAVREVLGEELSREALIANVGMPLREQMIVLDPERADELVAAYREFNHREHDRMLRLYPGMGELLHGLRQAGMSLGLVTSKSRATTQMAFDLTGIGSLFSAVVCAEDTARNKPYPEPILHCLELLGARPEEAVYVGDSPYDMQAAKAAGVPALAVGWGVFGREVLLAEKPDLFLETISELAAALEDAEREER